MPDQKRTPRRGPRGRGYIFWDRAAKVWVGRIPRGRSPGGHTVYQQTSDPSREKLAAKLALLRPPGPDVTVAEFAERWLAHQTTRPQTAENRAIVVVKRINPVLGHLRLASLTPLQVEMAARLWGEQYEVGTVCETLSVLNTLCRAAVREEVIPRSPVSLAKKPRRNPAPIRPFTPAELQAIIAAASRRPMTGIIAILAATGIRRGEAIALEVPDFEPRAQTIAITKTAISRRRIGPPKSPHSIRTITVPDDAIPAIRSAIGARKSGPIFRAEQRLGDNRSISPGAVGYHWERLLKRLRLSFRKLHDLRHSVATMLIAAGESIGDCARFLGDTESTIVATYLHPTGTDPAKTMNRLLAGKTSAKRRG